MQLLGDVGDHSTSTSSNHDLSTKEVRCDPSGRVIEFLYMILLDHFLTQSTLSTLTIFLIHNFIWFLLIIDYESYKNNLISNSNYFE